MQAVKHIPLPHVANVRDVGGILNEDGKLVRWGRLYRADALNALTAEEWQTLFDYGVRTVVDLRSRSEAISMPDRVPEGIRYLHRPMQEEDLNVQNLSGDAAAAFRRSMEQCYTDMVLETPHLLCAALSAVTEGLSQGAVLFHCTAGKDRTGVLAAVVLFLLGVYESDIVADYEVSNTYNRTGLQRALRELPNYEELLPMLSSKPEHIRALLLELNKMDLPRYLSKNGFSKEQQDALRRQMLCDM